MGHLAVRGVAGDEDAVVAALIGDRVPDPELRGGGGVGPGSRMVMAVRHRRNTGF